MAYNIRNKAIVISGVIVLAGLLVVINLKTSRFHLPQAFSLIGMILGALIIPYVIREAPNKHAPEIILAALKKLVVA